MQMTFRDKDGKILNTVKIVKAVRMKTADQRFYLEPVEGGARLLWSSGIVDEFPDVADIQIERETE